MSITQSDIKNIIDIISSGDIESLSADDFAQFQYQGFDPLKIVESLLKTKKDKSISEPDFKKDVYTMVAIGMIKGSITLKNLEKMSSNGKKSVEDLNAKYGIMIGGGKGQPSNVVTYPRIMATFPDVAVRMVEVIGPKEFRGPMKSSKLPDFLQVQVFPAVIPRDLDVKVKRFLLTASLCYSIDQSIQISQIKDPNLTQLASDQSNFTMVGHNSPVPNDNTRKNVFSKLKGLSGRYSDIADVVGEYMKLDSSFVIPTQQEFVAEITKFVTT